ncbi:phosphoglucosamine mutase [Nocardioides sp. NPDC006273]|uniref:phosphoglucosamine mutase n=1 Tax=Nocardioides sp. NPDC006273 TaxID=3155598 RepID=UPI0033B80AA7
MARLFGTDGVRGLANGEILTASLAQNLATSAALVLTEELRVSGSGRKPLAVIGNDSRVSGQFLQATVAGGLASAGCDVIEVGVLPTPGVAYLTAALQADLGVVISASHNPMPDNGIKFLQRGGHKLDDVLEDRIEAHLDEPWDRPTGASVGRISFHEDPVEAYAAHLVSTLERRLDGLTVVVDCANGAAAAAGPLTLRQAGAKVIAINDINDGLSINDGVGSTHPEMLQKAVVEHGADVGFAWDGDADRCLAVDGDGNLVDGDQLIAILALGLHDTGRLPGDTVVVTVMSNLGFVKAMDAAGVQVKQTAVGDRYVLEEMRRGGYTIGGEQSGHIIMSEHATTGDGILTALHVLQRMSRTGRTLADLASAVTRLPQVLLNVKGVDKTRCKTDDGLLEAIAAEEKALAGTGRILLRPSGTENLVRVMVEAPTHHEAEACAERLAGVVRARLAL